MQIKRMTLISLLKKGKGVGKNIKDFIQVKLKEIIKIN